MIMAALYSWHLLRSSGAPRVGKGLKLLAAGLGTLLLFWSAPMLVGHTPLRQWLAEQALSDLSATVTVGRASLGWLSPVVLQQVELRDRASRPLFVAARIETRKSLLALLVDHSDLGTVRLEQPVLQVVFSGPQSNLEEVLASWRAPDVAVGLEAVDGQLSIHDDDRNRGWTFSMVNLVLSVPRHDSGPTRLALHAHLADPGPDGALAVEGVLPMTKGSGSRSGCLSLGFDALPLALAVPLLRRTEPSLQVDGRLHGHLDYTWSSEDGAARQHVEGRLAAQEFSVEGPWLAGERLHLANLELAGRVVSQGSQLQLERAELRCDLGHASLDGTVTTSPAGYTMLARSRYEVRADLDLARTAAALPHALAVRSGTALTAGQLHLEVSSAPSATETAWKGRLQTSDLVATARGQQIVWPEPLAVAFHAHQPAGQAMVLDHFHLASDFLQVEAARSDDAFTATARYDLGQLAERLKRILDLGSLRLAGRGLAQAKLARNSAGGFQAHGEAELRELELSAWYGRAWQEKHLTLCMDVAGRTEADGRRRVDSASLRLQEDEEQLALQLLEPIVDARSGPWGPVSLYVRGDLAQWQRRLWPGVAGYEGWQLAGLAELTSRVSFHDGDLEVKDLKVVARAVQCSSAGVAGMEREIVLETSGHWQPAHGKLVLAGTKLLSETVSLQAPHLECARGPGGKLQCAGTVALAGDLARLHRWTQEPVASPREGLSGQFSGQLAFQQAEDRLSIRSEWTLANVALARHAAPPWHEPRVHMLVTGSYDYAAQVVQLEQLRLESLALACTGAGTIARPTSYVQLTGWITYDLERLGALLRPYLGSGLAGAGQDTRLFRLQASLPSSGASNGWLWLSLRGSKTLDGGACLRLPTGSEPSHFWRQLWWALRR
jgi:hypothetical protein